MIRVYKDAPTKVDLLKTVVLIEKEIDNASPAIQEQVKAMKAALRADKFKEAAKYAKLISVAGKSGNPAKIAKTRMLAKALIERVKQYGLEHPKKEVEENSGLSESEKIVRDSLREFIEKGRKMLDEMSEYASYTKKISKSDNLQESERNTTKAALVKLYNDSTTFSNKYTNSINAGLQSKNDILKKIVRKAMLVHKEFTRVRAAVKKAFSLL